MTLTTAFQKLDLFLLILQALLTLCHQTDIVLETITRTVDASTCANYQISREGPLIVRVRSLAGDCDIYANEGSENPSIEPELHSLQSATCGTDEIYITAEMTRPLGVCIYGHPSHDSCKYQLDLIIPDLALSDNGQFSRFVPEFYSEDSGYVYSSDSDKVDASSYDDYRKGDFYSKVKDFVPKSKVRNDDSESGVDDSILWVALLGLIKLVLEILL